MTQSFLSLDYGEGVHIVARSRFLGFAFFIDSPEDAHQKLTDLKNRFADATHICYAYVADPEGINVRLCDDGEPSGTAGMPILDVIKAAKLSKVLIAVVRYFGGTKLGTGGLGRAYSECAQIAVNAAKKQTYVLCNIVGIELDFMACARLQSHPEATILNADYGSNVKIEAAFKKSFNHNEFINELTNGRAQIQFITQKYVKMQGKSFD